MARSGLAFTEHGPTDAGGDPEILVVLVHGSMDRGTSFRRVVDRLADVRVLTYDRRGYAKSRLAGAPPTSLDGQAGDLLELLARRPAVVVGHSFGGDIALAASLLSPSQVRAVVAYEPPMPWLSWWPSDNAGRAALVAGADEGGSELAAESFMRRMVGDQVWERLPQSTRNARRSEGPALLADMACLHRAGGDVLDPSLVTVPVVLGVGTQSRPHHRENALRLPQLIEHAELVEVEGSGHGCHISHPDQFAAIVRRAIALAQ